MLIILFLISCKPSVKEGVNSSVGTHDSLAMEPFNEGYRPQFHFSPPTGWMNDPNGLVYHNGVYHLFYQYYPDDIIWGPMHWGHATSTDLLYWKHQGIKLFPDEHGYIFSGSAVVDHHNTSGLGSVESPPLVAVFTYHDAKGANEGQLDYQTQGIAFSNDNGGTWTKYEGNPVLENPGLKDFRDPKVRWHEPSGTWIMSLAVGDHISFYGSTNLIQWSKLSEFGKDKGAHGGVWECPDLFPMTVEGTGEIKWVLLVSINAGGPNGGTATQYFTGSFDGISFVPDDTKIRWIDSGADNYAGVTFDNVPGNRKVFIGWMSNWAYAQQTPTLPWRSAMTLPREITLVKGGDGYYLRNLPVRAFEQLRSSLHTPEQIEVNGEYTLAPMHLDQAEIQFKTGLNKDFSVKLSNEEGEMLVLTVDPSKELLSIDRRQSGKVEFNKDFANRIHILPYEVTDSLSEVRIIMDRSSCEVFIDSGRYVMTEQVFPNRPYDRLSFTSNKNITINSFHIYHLKSIWKNE